MMKFGFVNIIVLRYSGPVNIIIVCNGCGLGSPGGTHAHKSNRDKEGVWASIDP